MAGCLAGVIAGTKFYMTWDWRIVERLKREEKERRQTG
jgi:hypothetical protein